MLTVEPPLQDLEARAREAAAFLRARALEIDSTPEDTSFYGTDPGLQFCRDCTVPIELTKNGEGLGNDHSSVAHSILSMTLARGDAGGLLAAPGAALAGLVVDLLGTEQQRESFYCQLDDRSAHTFCAITEPAHGSDAAGLESRLRPGDGCYLLSGTKRYVGQASRGAAGVVFARTGPSLASIRAVMITPDLPGVVRTSVPTYGVRGAFLGQLELDDVPVAESALLGGHLPKMRRGLWGAMQAFNIMRVQVASLAIGTCEAILDYVGENGGEDADIATLRAETLAVRDLILRGAHQCDADATVSHLSSLAKLAAVALVVRVSEWGLDALGPHTPYEHPLLEKWHRDARGFEFMEGVSPVQRTNVAVAFEKRARIAG